MTTTENRPNLKLVHGQQREQELENKTIAFTERLRERLLTTDEIMALPEPTWLIAGVLPTNSLTTIWGPPGSAKSFVALDWALSVASGAWWFNREVMQGGVLYVAAEGASGLSRRVRAWSEARNVHGHDNVRWLPETVNLLDAAQGEALERLIDEEQPILVVIDTLARSMAGGDENAAQDMGRLIERVDAIRKRTKATVLLVHHATKEGSSARGSGALKGAVDTEIEVKKEGPSVQLFCRKQKDAEHFNAIQLQLVAVQSSCVLSSSQSGTESKGPERDLLRASRRVFAESFSESGASAAEFRKALIDATGCSEASFYRVQNELLSTAFLKNTGTSRFKFLEPGDEYVAGPSSQSLAVTLTNSQSPTLNSQSQGGSIGTPAVRASDESKAEELFDQPPTDEEF